MTFDDYQPRVSRRFVLRGLGATLTLPWLESLAWATGGPAAEKVGPPRRFAAVVFANGVIPDRWDASARAGAKGALELSDLLEPLSPLSSDLLVIDNLRLVKNPPYVLPHGTHYTNLLSGYPVQKQSVPRMAVTLDQYLARQIGRQTVAPVLNLGLCNGEPRGALLSTVSWASPDTPVMPELYPALAFDRLFDVTNKLRDKSILDDVLAQAKGVESRLGAADRAKLDEFLHSVRDVETRIARSATAEREAGAWTPTVTKPDMPRPKDGRPASIPEYAKLMMDILLLAFRMDRTRVATLQFSNDGINGMRMGFLEGVPNEDEHSISHHSNAPERMEHHAKVIRYHASQFAYLLKRMKAVDEGGRSLLDSSMVLFGTNFIHGHTHDTKKLPLLIAGKGGGTIKPGRFLRVDGEDKRAACNVYLSLLQRMGVPDKSFGDSTTPFEDLS